MGIRSEYQNQFKASTLKKYLSIYYENVAFRTARRDREYSHTPLSWCDDDDTDADSIESEENRDIGEDHKEISTATVTLSNKMTVPQTVSLEKSTDEEEDTSSCDEKKIESNGNNHNNKCLEQVEDDISLHLKLQDEETTVCKPAVRSSKDMRPDRRQKIPRAARKKHPSSRSASATVGTSASATTQSTVGHPAPFFSYGWAQTDHGLSQHKTFNIRSTADVHPDALRAHSRRKAAIKDRAVCVERSREDKVKAILAKSCAGPAPQEHWRSEYQQRYPAYDRREYMRSQTARSLDVNERKLCRVVYVS